MHGVGTYACGNAPLNMRTEGTGDSQGEVSTVSTTVKYDGSPEGPCIDNVKKTICLLLFHSYQVRKVPITQVRKVPIPSVESTYCVGLKVPIDGAVDPERSHSRGAPCHLSDEVGEGLFGLGRLASLLPFPYFFGLTGSSESLVRDMPVLI